MLHPHVLLILLQGRGGVWQGGAETEWGRERGGEENKAGSERVRKGGGENVRYIHMFNYGIHVAVVLYERLMFMYIRLIGLDVGGKPFAIVTPLPLSYPTTSKFLFLPPLDLLDI